MGMFGLFKPNVERMEEEKDIEGLIKASGYRRNANVRKKAAEALGRIGESAIEQLVRALNDKDQFVREGAEEAIVRLCTRDIRPFAEIFERDDVDINAKRSLMLVLQIIPGAIRALDIYHIPPLGTAASNDDAIEAKKDVKGLIEAPGHKDRDVRIKAVEALGKIGDARATAALIQTVKIDISIDVIQKAEEALGKIGDTKAVEPLVQALKDESFSQYVRMDIVEALGKMGDARVVEPLIQAMEDESYRVRSHAAGALGKIGDARAVEPLVQALRDKSPYVREEAEKALGRIKAKKSWK